MPENSSILVVEDDPVLKNLLGHTLAGKYKKLYASDGHQAISLIETNKPKLILLDLMLPDMDGFAVLKEIRSRSDELKNVPIIIVSNLGQSSDVERAKSLGANDYLIKAEVSIEEIVNKIVSMLGEAPITASPESEVIVPEPATPTEY